ncbi:hypothetical protein HF086_013745 [Spodoptera exigua]|uniref:Uncharacterized protein n=1 Tax=Spodoptera exigua TaxID=7107 RepID=A0A922SDL7_SPOEX|nr:hypothetical protein HF086_013745 [Spodoptera exigua]
MPGYRKCPSPKCYAKPRLTLRSFPIKHIPRTRTISSRDSCTRRNTFQPESCACSQEPHGCHANRKCALRQHYKKIHNSDHFWKNKHNHGHRHSHIPKFLNQINPYHCTEQCELADPWVLKELCPSKELWERSGPCKAPGWQQTESYERTRPCKPTIIWKRLGPCIRIETRELQGPCQPTGPWIQTQPCKQPEALQGTEPCRPRFPCEEISTVERTKPCHLIGQSQRTEQYGLGIPYERQYASPATDLYGQGSLGERAFTGKRTRPDLYQEETSEHEMLNEPSYPVDDIECKVLGKWGRTPPCKPKQLCEPRYPCERIYAREQINPCVRQELYPNAMTTNQEVEMRSMDINMPYCQQSPDDQVQKLIIFRQPQPQSSAPSASNKLIITYKYPPPQNMQQNATVGQPPDKILVYYKNPCEGRCKDKLNTVVTPTTARTPISASTLKPTSQTQAILPRNAKCSTETCRNYMKKYVGPQSTKIQSAKLSEKSSGKSLSATPNTGGLKNKCSCDGQEKLDDKKTKKGKVKSKVDCSCYAKEKTSGQQETKLVKKTVRTNEPATVADNCGNESCDVNACTCHLPPAYNKHFDCSGNISGNCNCNKNNQ